MVAAAMMVMVAACGRAPVVPVAAPMVTPVAAAREAEVPTADALLADVRWLADPARQGRGAGEPGEQLADDWLAARFAKLGLVPAGDDHSWFQAVPLSGLSGDRTTRNVVAWLPGRDPTAPWVLVGAHVDHLGVDAAGDLYPGADDNASGVAGMLGVATALAASPRLRGSILFVGFGGEEAGLLGSRWLAAHAPRPLAQCAAVINLDMIGRSPFLGARDYATAKQLFGIDPGPAVGVLDANPTAPLLATARAACGTAGIRMFAAEDYPLFESRIRAEAANRSDDSPFAQQHVPTLFFSTSLQDDYHRPTDTADKIDAATLHAITQAVRLTAQQLADDGAAPR